MTRGRLGLPFFSAARDAATNYCCMSVAMICTKLFNAMGMRSTRRASHCGIAAAAIAPVTGKKLLRGLLRATSGCGASVVAGRAWDQCIRHDRIGYCAFGGQDTERAQT